jgi:CRISPR-associated protein Cas2
LIVFVIVAYDIRTDTREGCRRLRRVSKICQGCGQRVQNSVFECVIDDAQYLQLVDELRHTMKATEDNVRLYRIPGMRADLIQQLGVSRAVDFAAPLVL